MKLTDVELSLLLSEFEDMAAEFAAIGPGRFLDTSLGQMLVDAEIADYFTLPTILTDPYDRSVQSADELLAAAVEVGLA